MLSALRKIPDASVCSEKKLKLAFRFSASNAPVTRHQMVIHSLDWLKERLEEPSEELYEALKVSFADKRLLLRPQFSPCPLQDLILLAVTDVWSQVRSAAANRMGPVVDKLSLDQVQNIFEEFARVSAQVRLFEAEISAHFCDFSFAEL